MPTDNWVRERADRIVDWLIAETGQPLHDVIDKLLRDSIATSLQEARSEERALAAEALRENRFAGYVAGRDELLDRLRNPDEALVDAMRRAEPRIDDMVCRKLSRALADTLDEKEG